MAKKRKKSKDNKTWLYIGLAALLFGGLWLYRQSLKIMVTGGYFRVHKLNGLSLELRVFLQITNESNLKIDVQNFLGQILYKGSSLGTVVLFKPAQIQPFGVQEIEFKANISLLSAGTEIYNILTTKDFSFNPQDLRVKGTLKAEGVDIPINEALTSG